MTGKLLAAHYVCRGANDADKRSHILLFVVHCSLYVARFCRGVRLGRLQRVISPQHRVEV